MFSVVVLVGTALDFSHLVQGAQWRIEDAD